MTVIILLLIYLLSLSQHHAIFRRLRKHSWNLRYVLHRQRSLHSNCTAHSYSLYGRHLCFFHLSGSYSNIHSLRKQLFGRQKSLFLCSSNCMHLHTYIGTHCIVLHPNSVPSSSPLPTLSSPMKTTSSSHTCSETRTRRYSDGSTANRPGLSPCILTGPSSTTSFLPSSLMCSSGQLERSHGQFHCRSAVHVYVAP